MCTAWPTSFFSPDDDQCLRCVFSDTVEVLDGHQTRDHAGCVVANDQSIKYENVANVHLNCCKCSFNILQMFIYPVVVMQHRMDGRLHA